MNDWRLLAMDLVGLAVGIAPLAYPKPCQDMSKRFEEGKSMIPFPPTVGAPLWMARLLGIVSAAGAALFF